MSKSLEDLKNLPADEMIPAGLAQEVIKRLIFEQDRRIPFSKLDDYETIGTKELAQLSGVTTSAVEKWRRVPGAGPAFMPGSRARYRVKDVKEWIAKTTVKDIGEAKMKGLSHFILEDFTAFPVFRYADGSMLGLEASIQYEQDHPETFCESFAVVNMGDAWAQHKDLYDGLLSNQDAAQAILQQTSVAKNFDVAYWLFVQFIGGKLDNFQPLLKAIRLLVEHGTDINAQNNMTGYNLAHVLAINEEGFINENDFYNFMSHLLDMGLDVDLMNNESISGRDIAEQNDTSPSTSNFLKVLNKRDFASSLEAKLTKKTK